MLPWISEVIYYQQKESHIQSSRWLQLATLGLDNYPRVRTVVFRGWSDTSEMKILSDKRSQKYFELESNNKVEICWLFQESKCQFRFRGNSSIDFGKDRLYHWKKLDDLSKSMWSWPSPGDKFELNNNNNNQILIDKNIINNDNFILLRINFIYVEQLLIMNHVHLRRRWMRDNEWNEEQIYP